MLLLESRGENRVLPLMGARELAVFINGNISELFKETGY